MKALTQIRFLSVPSGHVGSSSTTCMTNMWATQHPCSAVCLRAALLLLNGNAPTMSFCNCKQPSAAAFILCTERSGLARCGLCRYANAAAAQLQQCKQRHMLGVASCNTCFMKKSSLLNSHGRRLLLLFHGLQLPQQSHQPPTRPTTR